jgi:hypothetical protein
MMISAMVLWVFVFAGNVFGGTEGNVNTFYGMSAGTNTTGDDDNDTFIGAGVGRSNTTGASNTFLGCGSGLYNTVGNNNTFLGSQTGLNNTSGSDNIFLGYFAGYANTTGNNNTFLGQQTGYLNTTGSNNIFLGPSAGYANTTGNNNIFLGYDAGFSNTTGTLNTFLGYCSGFYNTTGSDNVFLGPFAGHHSTTGFRNTFLGGYAGLNHTTGQNNISLGFSAGYSSTTGYQNIFLGPFAGFSNTEGFGNILIGFGAGFDETGSNKLYIANTATATPLIYGEFDNQKLTVNGNLNMVGANGWLRLSNTTADSTAKAGRMLVDHYLNSQLPVMLIQSSSNATANLVRLGGGYGSANAATQIDLYTAANNTTPTGTSRLTIKSNGYVGLGRTSPTYPLHMASGAHVTTGGVWVNVSSRETKDRIQNLSSEEALDALRGLNAVKFVYKADRTEKHVGFIAEDVPELLATKDRKGLSSLDITAVLTKVVQEQQKTIALLTNEINELKKKTQ